MLLEKGKLHNTTTSIILALSCIFVSYATYNYYGLTTETIFKFYFLVSSVFFLSTYSERFKYVEKITIICLLLGLFSVLSFTTPIIIFSSLVLIILSIYGFYLTRARPNRETITATFIILILILLYKTTPQLAVPTLTVLILLLTFKADNNSTEALLILFLMPLLIYLGISYVTNSPGNMLFIKLTRAIGLATIFGASILSISKKFKNKRMLCYTFFYVGHAIFAISINSPEATAILLFMTFLLPFIYSSNPSFLSIFNLSMFPLSPVFIAKFLMLNIVIKNHMYLDAVVIGLASATIMIPSVSDLANIVLDAKRNKNEVPFVLKALSLLLLLASLIFLDTIINAIKITVWTKSF